MVLALTAKCLVTWVLSAGLSLAFALMLMFQEEAVFVVASPHHALRALLVANPLGLVGFVPSPNGAMVFFPSGTWSASHTAPRPNPAAASFALSASKSYVSS